MPDTPKPGTPLPWTSNEIPGQLANSIWTVENDYEDPTYIATVQPPMFSWAQPKPATADENARYIAYACNTLPELEDKLAELEQPCVWKMYHCDPVGGYYVGSCGFEYSEHERRDWMKFCPYCGHRITEESEA